MPENPTYEDLLEKIKILKQEKQYNYPQFLDRYLSYEI